MIRFISLVLLLANFTLYAQDSIPVSIPENIRKYIIQNPENELPSKSNGTVSAGTLENGKLMPYLGKNFGYFDSTSYVNSRAYVHSEVRKTVLDVYQQFETLSPARFFYVMECSNKDGGKMYPHHTHQNGLSIDFMTPLLQNDLPYTALDTLGADHYWLEFDNTGKYTKDQGIAIDFNLAAQHIFLLEQTARKYGCKIAKVIFKLELKDELFATEYGKKLEAGSVYFAKNLPDLINSLHDDHYHIDFEML
jgi:penicillin-insensitive murein DD-endopeptidase